MSATAAKNLPPLNRKIDWITTAFLVGVPIVALIGTPYYIINYGLTWELVIPQAIFFSIPPMCITMGYHRLFSHLTYQASPWLRAFYAFFGAAAWESSVLKWCTDHRRHHRHVDTNEDPYNIHRGFFYAHFGWLCLETEEKYKDKYAEDLEADPMLRFQHKYYIPIAILMGFGVPTLLGAMVGRPLGGLILGGFLRITINQHTTFFINSLAHMWGRRPYSEKLTAVDNSVLAFLTYGEGYHNFHHRFATDYRNGVRWFEFDPSKWMIFLLSKIGVARNLKRIPATEILRAKLAQEQKDLLAQGASPDRLASLKEAVEQAQKRIKVLKEEYAQKRVAFAQSSEKKIEDLKASSERHLESLREGSRKHLRSLKAEMKVAKMEFRLARARWGAYRKSIAVA